MRCGLESTLSDGERTAVVVEGQLVRPVATVLSLIADPRRRNTASVVTAEQSRLAVPPLTVALVRFIAAVVDAVTHLKRQSTVEVVALELARLAVTNRCSTHTTSQRRQTTYDTTNG